MEDNVPQARIHGTKQNFSTEKSAQDVKKQNTASVSADAETQTSGGRSSIAPLPSWSRRGYKVGGIVFPFCVT